MMDATDPNTGIPLFDENTFLDEEQIKSYFATLSRPRKRSVSTSKKRRTSLSGSAASAAFAAENVAGLDYDDDENEAEKQELEEALNDLGAQGRDAMVEEIAADIENALNKDDSDECPIIVHGINLCEMAEQIQWAIGDPLSELSREDTEKRR